MIFLFFLTEYLAIYLVFPPKNKSTKKQTGFKGALQQFSIAHVLKLLDLK